MPRSKLLILRKYGTIWYLSFQIAMRVWCLTCLNLNSESSILIIVSYARSPSIKREAMVYGRERNRQP